MKDCRKKAAFPKAVLSVILAILLVVSPLVSYAEDGDGEATVADNSPSIGISAEAEKDSSDTAEKEEAESEDGTEAEEVFSEELEISSEEELRAFAQRVNDGDSMSGVLVKLTGNISVAGDTLWVPIGNDAMTPFSGVFDGQGYKVEGFQVSNDVNGGLFGFLLNAKIRNLTLTNFTAGNSTGGMFFSAIGTSVEMSRGQTNGITTMGFNPKPVAGTDMWGPSYARSITLSDVNGVYTINFAADLAYIADQVNSGADDFDGYTISLAQNLNMTGGTWTPIGDYATSKPFKGRFVGNGMTIEGLDNALFGYTEGATISKVALEDSNVTATDESCGILINIADSSVISQIEILNSNIDATITSPTYNTLSGTGGVIGSMGVEFTGSGYAAISQIFVKDTHVKGDDGVVGGIVGFAEAVSISECVIYGGSVTNTAGDEASGIAGIFGNAAFAGGMRDCLVVGTDFGSATKFSGLTWLETNQASVSNNVVSDIRSSVTPSAASTSAYIGVGSTNQEGGGLQYNFTDSPLGYRFIDDPDGISMDGIVNNYWDSQRDLPTGLLYDLPSGKDYNQAMSTATLTNGTWLPNQESWTATENFYPQLSSLARLTWNTDVPLVSAVASLALVPSSVEDNYVVGAGELFLPGQIQVDESYKTINWFGYDALVSSGQLKKISVAGGVVLSATGANVTISNITAEIDGYVKRFDNVTVADITLAFSHSSPAKDEIVDETLPTITVVFDELIAENPLASGKLAELQVLAGSQYVQHEVFYLDSTIETPSRFAVGTDGAGKGQAVFTLGSALRPGKEYRLVLPSGAVQQQGNDRALSEHIEIDFSTAEVGKPIINFTKELVFPLDQVFATGDLLSNVVIKDFDGALMYDGAAGSSPITPQEYTGPLWDNTNTNKSQKDILDSMPVSSIRYVIADPDTFDVSVREAGTYHIYIIAKNAKGKGAYRVMPFTLQGSPEWINKPDPVVHIQWTKDKQAFIDAAKQNAIAAIPQKNGSSVPCSVEVVFNEQDWLSSLAFTEGPFTIETQVMASDNTGAVTTSVPVTVFLDKPLYYTLTPSPITMSFSTPRQVEERINLLAINFNRNIVKYDHWDNDYRKPRLYYVDVYSDPQIVTDCQLAKCPYSNHPEDVVNSIFAVNIVQTPGAEITSFWGTAMAELDAAVAGDSTKESDYPYSKNIVRVSPQTYRMPAFVPEYLKKQEYGRMEVNYGDYRWNLYSNTLDVWNIWGDEYNLEATLDSVDNGAGNAIQVKFVQEGRLFGTVEFDISMEAARKLAPNLPDENLGLYRYDGRTRELVLISDVIVEDGKWASALLQDIYPTAYVLKTKGSGDVMVSSGPDELIQFYVHTKVVDPDTRMISDGDPELVTLPTDRTELINLITGQVSQELLGIGTAGEGGAESPNDPPRSGLPLTAIIIAAIIILLAGGSVAAVVLIRRREGK